MYAAGDQTDDDWRSEPAVEEAVVASGAIPGGSDIDVFKVSHHGSDTSNSPAFIQALDPEVAVISSKFRSDHRLPKRITLKQVQENRCYVLITGEVLDPATGDYSDSPNTSADDPGVFSVSQNAVFNSQGNVTVLVSRDGGRYTVIGDSFGKTFSAADADNQR